MHANSQGQETGDRRQETGDRRQEIIFFIFCLFARVVIPVSIKYRSDFTLSEGSTSPSGSLQPAAERFASDGSELPLSRKHGAIRKLRMTQRPVLTEQPDFLQDQRNQPFELKASYFTPYNQIEE